MIRKFAARYNIGGFVRILHTKLEVQLRRRERVKAKGSFDATYWAGHKEVAALELRFDGPKPVPKASTTTASSKKRKREPTPNIEEISEEDEGDQMCHHPVMDDLEGDDGPLTYPRNTSQWFSVVWVGSRRWIINILKYRLL